MAQETQDDENQLTESTAAINYSLSELPGRPFSITMELPLFVTMFGMALSGTAIGNIILYRTCVHSLHHSEDECHIFLVPEKNNETNGLEDEVQKYVTFVTTMRMVMESIVPVILSMFLGVWSDTHGRKPLVVWPLFGITLSSMLMVVYSMLENLGPWWYLLTMVPFSLTGGFTVLFTGAFCYLSDITTTESRSLRMTVLEAAVSLGTVLGFMLSMYLLKAVGSVYLLLIVSALNVVGYVFTNVHLKESLTGAVQGGLTTVLDFLLVKEMFNECFKRRPNNLRAQILLLTVANSLSIFILYGLIGIDYMYTRKKLEWALKDFTQYSAVSTTISFVGSFFGVAVIQKYLPVGDLAFSIVAFLTATAKYLIVGFAVQTWHMYLASAVGLFSSLSAPLIRSMLTKILPVEDIAKVFALVCALEGLCPLLSPVIYNSLYSATISIFPGAIMVLSGFITFSCTVMLGFVAYYRVQTISSGYQLHVES